MNELMAASPMFAAQAAADRAEAERKQRLAESLAHRRQLLAAGDVVFRQSRAVSERKRHLGALASQLAAVRQEGEQELLNRWGRAIKVGEQPDYQERVRQCEGAVRRCEQEVAEEQAKLDELQRLVQQLEHAPTA